MCDRRTSVLLSCLAAVGVVLFVAACGGDDDTGGPSESSTETAAGADAGGGGQTVEQLAAVAAAAEVRGYEVAEPMRSPTGGTVQRTYVGDGLQAHVTLTACDPFVCWDLDREVDAEHEQNLRSNLAPVHLDNPDLVFEYGNVEPMPGYEAFFTYSFSFVAEGSSKAATNFYRLLFHDDATLIMIEVQPEPGFLPDTAAAFQSEMDQQTGESVAGDVFAAYVDLFEPTG